MSDNAAREQARLDLIYDAIDQARAFWRTIWVLEGSLKTLLALTAAMLVGFVADNLFALPGGVRICYALTAGAGVVYLAVRHIVLPAIRPLTDEMVAAHIEKAYPDLDNRLINSILLTEEPPRDRLGRKMVSAQLDETISDLKKRQLKRATNPAVLWRWGKWLAVCAVLLTVYAAAFSGYFANAFQRFSKPHQYIPPITSTRLTVLPGDAERLQGQSLLVEARTDGVLPEQASIEVQQEGAEKAARAMTFEGSGFVYEFSSLQKSFTYRVRAGDALSRRYEVQVRSRPAVTGVDLSYEYPNYTRLSPETRKNSDGNISALSGTRVTLKAHVDRRVRDGRLEVKYLTSQGGEDGSRSATVELARSKPTVLAGEFKVERSGEYRIVVEDAEGIENDPLVRQIVARPDQAPAVTLLDPGKSVSVMPDEKVSLLAEAEDDFTLQKLELLAQRTAGGEWEALETWSYDPGERRATEGHTLSPADLGLGVGDVLIYCMQGSDGHRREVFFFKRKTAYEIRVVDPSAAAEAKRERRKALEKVVQKLIELQKSTLEATENISTWGEGQTGQQADMGDFRSRAGRLVESEETIYATATDAVRQQDGEGVSDMVNMLARIASGEITDAVGRLQQLKAARKAEDIEPAAESAVEAEREVVRVLERLLENPKALLAERLQQESEKEDLSEQWQNLTTDRQKAEKMLENIEKFKEDQEKVLELTSNLAQKPVDDFTEGDEEALEEVLETEKKWAEYFEETAQDLSKLPPQDFSLANQAKEHLEIYSEVQKAVDAAEKKEMELAVPLEQSGLELAEKLETNLEKWLMEDRDKTLWSMEDPIQDYDTPIAELPDELEDLIGDLMESEEDMTEQVEDVTSGWMDSLDKGAGWTAADGPISNMSAKGVTGNTMPNQQEIGGRSGEGRTGKSTGQFVEETATGKGGRKTPTRLTEDPYEGGQVDDKSGEPATGATGGGKMSGWGQEGLQGPPPPPVRQKLKRMANQQKELIDKARRVDYGLKKYRYPRGDLPKTIEMMEELQGHLEEGEIGTYMTKHGVVLTNLREVKELVDKRKQVWRDRSRLLPEEVREEISASADEEIPEEYREMVNRYYRALAESSSESEE